MADEREEEETVQLTLTLKQSTLDRLETLYPHFLKPQHQVIACVEEVERRREDLEKLTGSTPLRFEFDGAERVDHSERED
jgi:hypothetical protein